MINNIGDLNKSDFFTGVTIKPKAPIHEEIADLFVKNDYKLNKKIQNLENIFSK